MHNLFEEIDILKDVDYYEGPRPEIQAVKISSRKNPEGPGFLKKWERLTYRPRRKDTSLAYEEHDGEVLWELEMLFGVDEGEWSWCAPGCELEKGDWKDGFYLCECSWHPNGDYYDSGYDFEVGIQFKDKQKNIFKR